MKLKDRRPTRAPEELSTVNIMIIRDTTRDIKVNEIVEYQGLIYRRISVNDHMVRWEYDSSFMWMNMSKAAALEVAYTNRSDRGWG